MDLPFVKMNGLGNDFVVIDARKEPFYSHAARPECTRILANRRTGVGCDQLIVLEKGSNEYDCVMRIINNDGLEVGACGNATRCVASILLKENPTKPNVAIKTAAGILRCSHVDDNNVTVDMGIPKFEWNQIPLSSSIESNGIAAALQADGIVAPSSSTMCVNVGNPHVVFVVDNIDTCGIEKVGSLIEHNKLFPEMVNVNVVHVAGNALRLRTWERSSGITGACGTGACATMIACVELGKAPQKKCEVIMDGGSVWIEYEQGGHVFMTGPVATAFTGVVPAAVWYHHKQEQE